MQEIHLAVLDDELPLWVPIPALAEMQVAIEQAVGEVTGLVGFELKRVMRTGTVASVDKERGRSVAKVEVTDQNGELKAVAEHIMRWAKKLSSNAEAA